MQPVRINEAEAFLEPYFDASHSGLHETYEYRWLGGAAGRVRAGFAAVELDITPGEIGAPACVMEKACDADVHEYDELRALIGLPAWASVVIEVDGEDGWRRVVDSAGLGTTGEYAGLLPYRRITGVRYTFTVLKNTDITAVIRWLGAADRSGVQAMLDRRSPYAPEWPLMLRPSAEDLEFEPQIGIYFGGGAELETLRSRVHRKPHSSAFAKMVADVRSHLNDRPEDDIGKLVPKPDRRFCRDRDMDRISWAHMMENLAFVGLLEQDAGLSRMACRMALSAAHCEYWFESDIGVHPGKLWHHRSFTEEVYTRACALVLDWAGYCLTDYGRRVIQNAIATKGLPRIETDFMESEYIRHMNQGIVFSSGRIHGLLALVGTHPRYEQRIAEAERDMLDIIDDYVKEDGGTLEGPGYWHYTFMNAVATVYALARHRGKTLDEYAGESLKKTGAFEPGMLSTVGGGCYLLPINDCHRNLVHPDLAASYAAMTGDEVWRRIHSVAAKHDTSKPSYFSFIIAPDEAEDYDTAVTPHFLAYPYVGHVDWVAADDELEHVHFHFVAGPAFGGHYNCDKGSFIIEAGEDMLAIDRGVTHYSHPETNLLKRSARHNVLQPEPAGTRLPDQLRHCDPGARMLHAEARGAGMSLSCDVTGAWPEGIFTRHIRSVTAESPRCFVFTDKVELAEEMSVSFRVNTNHPITVEGASARIEGQGAALIVTPADWSPEEVAADEEGIDGEERPVNLLRLVTPRAKTHRITTRVEVVPT